MRSVFSTCSRDTERCGYRTVLAGNGKPALEVTQTERPDLGVLAQAFSTGGRALGGDKGIGRVRRIPARLNATIL
jgi:CheY-like chemotaxis protein